MADRIVYRYPDMESVAGKIDGYSTRYAEAGSRLISSIDAATADWEGASKDKFMALVNGSVNNYVTKSVPEWVAALAKVLRQDITSMQEADDQIAASIPDSI